MGLLVEALRAGRRVCLRARGQSMRPWLPDGSEVLLEPFAPPARVGDVVLVEVLGEHALHRVVETFTAAGRRYVRTRGDGRRTPDPPLPEEAVLGRAIDASRAPDGARLRLDAPVWRVAGWLTARLAAVLPR